MRISNAGKVLFGILVTGIIILFALAFWVYGLQIAWRVGLIGLGFIGFLLLTKLAKNNDGLVWLAGLLLAVFLLANAFGGGNYGSDFVQNQIPTSDWILIDGAQYLLREDGSFGYTENQRFVQAGWLSGTSMTFQNRWYTVNGFFQGWPIIVTGNLGENFEISFR